MPPDGVASRFQSIRAPALSNEKPKQKETMTTHEIMLVVYIVAAILTAAWVFVRLRDPLYYRLIVSAIVGGFWPIPVGLIVFLYIEGCIVDAAKWITEHFD